MMAIKGRSAEQQAALAKIVTPDTLDDIEEYIRPRFPPKSESGLSVERSLPSLNLASKRLIVQDGHGRWRERDKYFGIQTDEYGKWSAANVLHDRMKKKWDDYLNTLPKQAAERTFQKANILTPQMKRPRPPKGKKTHPVKPKMQKKELKKPSSESSTRLMPKDTTVHPLPPQVDIPVHDNDDNFWDFYDKPFNKPT
ncbi:uncharacterized protein [Montipora capricornis]|uniref:uncharacterized protein isoform X8 n=1 Tax=Montipora capricornis TaxID=246305 RepID=UPI0035F17A9C